MISDLKSLVGKRALIGTYPFASSRDYIPQEVKFLELSPSGKWVKIQYLDRGGEKADG